MRREVGRRMGIAGIPLSYDELERYYTEYGRHRTPTPATMRLRDQVLGLVGPWFPRPLQGAARRLAPVVIDDDLLRNRSYPGYPDGYDLAGIGAPDPPAGMDPAWLARDVRQSGS